MKHFSFSTILGLAFGIFLAGYAVFAFNPPTQAPPAGNVPAPINTGTSDQTKTGGLLNVFGLWVNQSLGVSGGATFGGALNLQGNRITNVGSPSGAGDVATKGFVDNQTSGLQKKVSGSCPTGQGVRSIGSDGSVTCENVGLIKSCSSSITTTCGSCGGASYLTIIPKSEMNRACASYCSERGRSISAVKCDYYGGGETPSCYCTSFDFNTCTSSGFVNNSTNFTGCPINADDFWKLHCLCH